MKKKREIGFEGEDVACEFLESIGYDIIERNFLTRHGEIDIIAENEGYIVFAEVKTRNYFPNSQYGRPARAVDNEKRKNLLRAAKAFVKYFGIKGYRLRFDVIEVYVSTDTVTKEHSFKVNHMKGVFGEGGRLV